MFAPTSPHQKQREVLDDPSRFKILRAGRKFRKTSLGISWLFENAILSPQTVHPYIAPNRIQAKNIAWDDHVARVLTELRIKKVPHQVNETELSVTFPHGGKIQLLGVENKEALRGISNWGSIFCDEYDDWQDDIWPTIIRPNLMVHKAPAIISGTPKGFRNMYRLSQKPEFKEFHFTSMDNPDLDLEELNSMIEEYKGEGEDYYRQEILAEYVKPVGVVYKEWAMNNFKDIEYDVSLPLYVTFDWGVNDPTVVIWLQMNGSELRVIDYYEAKDANIEHFVSVINAKPYKKPDMFCGDPAGKARTLTTGTSPIEMLSQKGIYVKTTDGVTIEEQVRISHTFIPSLFISTKADRFRECILNYRYPTMGVEKRSKLNFENEVPIHDEFSHAMRAFEYFCVNIRGVVARPVYKQPSRGPLIYGRR